MEKKLYTISVYSVSHGKWIHRISPVNEYAVLDRKLDTSYPMGVDMPYQSVSDTTYPSIGNGVLGFLRIGTTFDIFQNIYILYLEYGVLSSSGYDVLSSSGYSVLASFP
ncbi:hypothetical protein Tco_0332779 [Tanacetum coccineum]